MILYDTIVRDTSPYNLSKSTECTQRLNCELWLLVNNAQYWFINCNKFSTLNVRYDTFSKGEGERGDVSTRTLNFCSIFVQFLCKPKTDLNIIY